MRQKRYFFIFCAICAVVATALTLGVLRARKSALEGRSTSTDEATAAAETVVSPPDVPYPARG